MFVLPSYSSNYITNQLLCFAIVLEWKLSELGAVKTSLEKDPAVKKEIRDVLTVSLQGTAANFRDPDDSDEDY